MMALSAIFVCFSFNWEFTGRKTFLVVSVSTFLPPNDRIETDRSFANLHKRSRGLEDGRKELSVCQASCRGRNEKIESWKGKRGDKKSATGPLVCYLPLLGFLSTNACVAQLKQKFWCEDRINNFQSTLGNEPGPLGSLPRQALYLYATTTANSQ